MKHQATFLALLAATAASALQPAYAQTPPEPPPDQGRMMQAPPHVHDGFVGRVVYFKGYGLQIRTHEGYKNVVLHPGTVLNPRGLRLREGMFVRVFGPVTEDGGIDARQVDLAPRKAYDEIMRERDACAPDRSACPPPAGAGEPATPM